MPFSYMGSLVTSDGKSDRDIKQRIGKAKTVFGKMTNVLSTELTDKAMSYILLCMVRFVVRM